MSSNMMHQLPPEPSRQEAFEDLVMNFILYQEERVKQLEEYMGVIGSDFMQLSLKVVEKLKDEIRKPSQKSLLSMPLTSSRQNHSMSNTSTQSSLVHLFTLQVLPSFEENTPPVNYPDEVEEIIGILFEVEPLDKTPLEDLGLNTCNHDIPLISKEIPNFDKPEPQPQPLPSCPPLDISLGEERGPKPPIKPHSSDSFKMKVVDNLTIHIPPSPHVASFYPKDVYCYYHPCVEDPKKHYGFKPGLLGQSGSLGVDIYLNYQIDRKLIG
ncbi:hypothetical protein Tco_0190409 [Tanacetum coccineum]